LRARISELARNPQPKKNRPTNRAVY
jgi:hypothetical protein